MQRGVGYLFAAWALFWVLPLAALVSCLLLPFVFIPRGQRERWCAPIAYAFAWICTYLILLARPSIIGSENLPAKRGYLVISNHRSWMDVVLLIYATHSLGIAKKEIAYVPFFGLAGWIAGAIFFDRQDKNSRGRVVDEAIQMMSQSANLHLFPEGTRSRNGRMGSARLKLVEAACKAGIPIVPAAVMGTEACLPTGKLQAYPWGQPILKIGTPIYPTAQDATATAEFAWQQVITLARGLGAEGGPHES